MGTPKPFLLYDNNSVFIEKIIESYLDFGCSTVVITIDDNERRWDNFKSKYDNVEAVFFVSNLHPEFERLYSTKIGLLEMNEINYCFLQNADNPFISPIILRTIYSRRKGNAYVVPNFGAKGGHPILLGNDVMNYILSIEQLKLSLKEVLMECQRIDCNVNDESVLININTPEDYKKYFGKIND